MHIVVGNSKKLQKGVWKDNPIKCIQIWANDINTLMFNDFYHNFKHILRYHVYKNEKIIIA